MTPTRSLQTRVLRSKRAGQGFTLVELLVVIAIIALILGIALPALSRARDQARIVSMRATLRVISTGLEQFNNDLQSYPNSFPTPEMQTDGPTGAASDFGAQLLVQAMLGWDGLGYVDGNDAGIPGVGVWYELDANNKPFTTRFGPYIKAESVELKSIPELNANVGPGLEKAADNAFGALSDNRVIVDIFRFELPLLYFRADTNGTKVASPADRQRAADDSPPAIYDFDDNLAFYEEGTINPQLGGKHFDENFNVDPGNNVTIPFPTGYDDAFQNYVWDPATYDQENDDPATDADLWDITINPYARPYNKDSFILISAGPDAIFGNRDDVTNFIR